MPVPLVNIVAVLPPARYDGAGWTSAVIEEAPALAGPWTQIDVQVLVADADPANPQARNFTTKNATSADGGWYRVTFKDAGGDQSQPSDPVRVTSAAAVLPPDPESIRMQSPLLRSKLSDPTDPVTVLDLRTLVYQATALVQSLTWRLIDPSLGCSAPEDFTCEAVPDALVPVAIEAISRMAERLYVTTEAGFAEQLATGRRLRGFNAGPYSESYFAPGEFARRGAQQGRPPVDGDDAIDAAVWALMTEDARDYFIWRATGVAPPTGVAVAFDYRKQSVGYGAGGLGGWPTRSGPDGF